MKKKLMKALSTCAAGIMIFSSMMANVTAEEGQSISINGRETKFTELFKVENGVTYLPIRLAFNDFVDQGFSVQVVPSMTKSNIAISVTRIDPETNEVNEDRRGLYINWNGDVTGDEEFQNGRLELYQYAKDENGNNYLPTENYRRPIALTSPIILLNVDDNGGQRAYMSTEDLNNMVRFLLDDANYSIKLK